MREFETNFMNKESLSLTKEQLDQLNIRNNLINQKKQKISILNTELQILQKEANGYAVELLALHGVREDDGMWIFDGVNLIRKK